MEKKYSYKEFKKNPPKYDRKHPQFDFPQIRGKKIIFNESGDSSEIVEVERQLRPLTLEKISEEDFIWLNSKAKGNVTLDCGYQGISQDTYVLVRNPKTKAVALKWQGRLVIDSLEFLAVRFYDGITEEISRLKIVLEQHRKGVETGWGDAQIDNKYMLYTPKKSKKNTKKSKKTK